jgi:hypothetical protein
VFPFAIKNQSRSFSFKKFPAQFTSLVIIVKLPQLSRRRRPSLPFHLETHSRTGAKEISGIRSCICTSSQPKPVLLFPFVKLAYHSFTRKHFLTCRGGEMVYHINCSPISFPQTHAISSTSFASARTASSQ